MGTPEQRSAIARKIYKDIIPKCCNGDQEAEEFLKTFFYIIRIIDDIQDEDYPVTKEEIISGYFKLMAELPNNSFYRKHLPELSSVALLGFNAWQDSNRWQHSDNELKRMYSNVLRDYICEMFTLVGFLTGGTALMHEVSSMVRETFLKHPED